MPGASTSKAHTKKGGGAAKPESEDEIQESGEEEGEEYEVESISNHRGKGKSLEYRVSWVGYGPEWDTWEPAAHVTDATEAVNAYWDSRDSLGQAPPGSKKRRRPSANSSTSKPGSTTSHPKKPRTSDKLAKPKSNGSVKAEKLDHESESSLEPEMTHADSWEKYDKIPNWESLVRSVDSVENSGDGGLDIWMTMKAGEKIRVSNSIVNIRCPQKIIKFYESHLKWKEPDQED